MCWSQQPHNKHCCHNHYHWGPALCIIGLVYTYLMVMVAHFPKELVKQASMRPSAGQMRLADFGLARAFGSPGRGFTNQVSPTWPITTEMIVCVCALGLGTSVLIIQACPRLGLVLPKETAPTLDCFRTCFDHFIFAV